MNADLENRLQALFDKVKLFPSDRGNLGWIDLIELRNAVPDAIRELRTRRQYIERLEASLEPKKKNGRHGAP